MGEFLKATVLCSFLAFLLSGHIVFADVIYVDIDAVGADDGSSWEDAYTSLPYALYIASLSDEIRVAKGTYTPDIMDDFFPPDPEATFVLNHWVTLKGGYAGSGEPNPNARDFHLYETILSGESTFYHVVTGGDYAVLDGFTIANGYSKNAPASLASYGAGMYNCRVTNLTVSNCIFSHNSARFGGGMYNHESDITLFNCVFRSNSAVYNGGALRETYGNSVITNCTFYSNYADTGNAGYVGGGIANYESDSVITNCIFSGNTENGSVVDESAQIDLNGGTTFVSYTCINCGEELNEFAGNGNISSDPLMGNPKMDDFHLASQSGRWEPDTLEWVYDDVTSPCIDAGDPTSIEWQNELCPQGGRINMGAYGGTPQASMSSNPVGNVADLDHDNEVSLIDLMLFSEDWLSQECLLDTDLNRNGKVDITDYALFAQQWLWVDP